MTIINCCTYKFESDQKKFGCVGSCGYVPASVKCASLKIQHRK